MWPTCLTFRGPNCSFDGFRVRRAACSALNMFSSSCMWPSQIDEQHNIYTVIHIYIPRDHSLDQSVRKLTNRNGTLAIPKGRRLKTHFPFCVTKAVLSCSLDDTGIYLMIRILYVAHGYVASPPTVSRCLSKLGIGHEFFYQIYIHGRPVIYAEPRSAV